MKNKLFISFSLAASIIIAGLVSGCSSSSSSNPEPDEPPVHLPENGGGDTPVIPMPPIEEEPPSEWPQELLEIEARFGIPAEDSWNLCIKNEVTCYWNVDSSTFQWLWYALEGKRDGDSVDVIFYLDDEKALEESPTILAYLSNEFLTDPVDQDQYYRALFEWSRCTAGHLACNSPVREVAFQNSYLDGLVYKTTGYQNQQRPMSVADMRIIANNTIGYFRIEQKYQQTGSSPTDMQLDIISSDERRLLFNTTADVLTHVYGE